MSLKLAIIGLPGAGKGTQSQKISEAYDIPHVSIGDILRANKNVETGSGKTVGELIDAGNSVPTPTAARLLSDRLNQPDCEGGFVIDGFPRFQENAEVMEDVADLDAILIINVEEDAIYDRLMHRRICPPCGRHYHQKYDPPEQEGRCDDCGTELVQREDDTRERIAERIEWQRTGLAEVRDFYAGENVIREVDGNASIETVWNRVQAVVEDYV